MEAASDSHIEFPVKGANLVVKKLGRKRSLEENLREFLKEKSHWEFMKLLNNLGVKYQVFHYD